MTTTFEQAQVGDKVWCAIYGWGVIAGVSDGFAYPINVQFKDRNNAGTRQPQGTPKHGLERASHGRIETLPILPRASRDQFY